MPPHAEDVEPPVNVLLVDDQPANLLALEALLAELGQNLVRASSGDEALRRLLAEGSDLAVAVPNVLRAVGEGLGWVAGGLWTVDRDAGVLRCSAFWHRPGVGVAEFEADSRRRAFAPGEGLPGRVWAAGGPLW